MGVMQCDRYKCNEVMCHTWMEGVGYVCNECQKEFKSYLRINRITAETEGALKRQLPLFMETPKGQYFLGKKMSVEQFFGTYEFDEPNEKE
jgi:hypothetical protein